VPVQAPAGRAEGFDHPVGAVPPEALAPVCRFERGGINHLRPVVESGHHRVLPLHVLDEGAFVEVGEKTRSGSAEQLRHFRERVHAPRLPGLSRLNATGPGGTS